MVSRSDKGNDSDWVLTLTIVVSNEAICKPAHSTFSVSRLTFRLPVWRWALRTLRVLRERWVANKEWRRALATPQSTRSHIINPFQCHSTRPGKTSRGAYISTLRRSVGSGFWKQEGPSNKWGLPPFIATLHSDVASAGVTRGKCHAVASHFQARSIVCQYRGSSSGSETAGKG